jgi:F-type H+-transporting ATPase subunit b
LIRRAALALALGMMSASSMLPQEAVAGSEAKTEHSDHEQGDQWIWWKWANFVILVGGLGYLIGKHAPAFFESRSKEILQGIADGTKALKDAHSRAAAVELRLAGIQQEIESLRDAARSEMTAESQRIQRETEHHLQRLQAQAAQEITLMTRASRDELRKYSAELALQLAEQRIRTRITKDTQNVLMDAFLGDLRHQPTPGVRA